MIQAKQVAISEKMPAMSPSIKDLTLLGIMGAVFLMINFIYPLQAKSVYSVSLNYLFEMALIVPPVFILMGLFEVWVPKTFIDKYMGRHSGARGMGLAFVFGTLPTGPLYLAFPIASSLLKKGASPMNVTIFLSTWAAAKLPQILVEIKFLGLAFATVRFVLTLSCIILIGFLVEHFSWNYPRKKKDFLSEERK